MTRRRSLSQAIAGELTSAIQEGEFRPGDRLPPERALMTRFGAGRNTVREAVQALVAQGLLDVRPGRGTTVLHVDGKAALAHQDFSGLLANSAVDDLYEFRMLLETDAAEKAAERADGAAKALIAGAMERYLRAAEVGVEVYRRDLEFHAAIARASRNTAYIAALEAVSQPLMVIRQRTDLVPGAIAQAAIEHGQICEFIQKGDAVGARAAMVVHLQTAKRTLAAARVLLEQTTTHGSTFPVPPHGGRA